MKFRLDIQILRGIAVLLVFLFHLEVTYFGNGYLGVDIFFVISGYLMAQLYDKGTMLDFYKRRLKRLLPVYIAVLGLTAFSVSLVALPVDARQLYDQVVFGLLGISNIGFWLENSYFSSRAFKPLLNLWSLGLELQYYLLVPFLLPVLRKNRILLFVVFFVSLSLAFYVTTISPKTSFFLLPFRIWEFLLGAIAAWFYSSASKENKGLLPSVLILICLFIVVFAYPLDGGALDFLSGHPGMAALLISLITCCFLTSPLHKCFSDNNVVGRLFVVLGEYSYSIYLAHFPIIVIFNYLAFGGTRLGFGSFAIFFWILFTTIVVSFLLYRYVESSRVKENFMKRFLIILSASLMLIVIGLNINKYRFSYEQNVIFSAWEDRDVYRCGKLFRLINPFEKICKISNVENGKAVLLVGNSHADSIKKSFSDTLKDHSVETYFYVNNSPLMTSAINANELLKDVTRLGVDTVVFHYSPVVYQQKDFLIQLSKVLSGSNALSVSVYFISPVPTYTFHVPRALYENTLEHDSSINGLVISDYLKVNADFFNFIQEQELFENVLYTHTVLCPKNTCLLDVNGVPLYFDKGHLTLTGSRILKPIFENVAARITGEN